MIPKILHFIWFGERRLSDEYFARILRWSDLNPDYQVNIWTTTDDNIADLLERMASAVIDHDMQISIKNIHRVGEVFGNYDLMQEMFELNAVLAAADMFKVDLMVHLGGVCVDLGVTPTAPLEDLATTNLAGDKITTRAEASMPKVALSPYCGGEYHLHVSAPAGEVYTLAQIVGRQLMSRLKKTADFREVFASKNPIVKYKATVATTGQFLFLAIDCLARDGFRHLPHFKTLKINSFGEAKPQALRQRVNTGEDLEVSERFRFAALSQAEYIRHGYLVRDHDNFEKKFPDEGAQEKHLAAYRKSMRLDLVGGKKAFPDYTSIQRFMWSEEPRAGYQRPEWHGSLQSVVEAADIQGGGSKPAAVVSMAASRSTIFGQRRSQGGAEKELPMDDILNATSSLVCG